MCLVSYLSHLVTCTHIARARTCIDLICFAFLFVSSAFACLAFLCAALASRCTSCLLCHLLPACGSYQQTLTHGSSSLMFLCMAMPFPSLFCLTHASGWRQGGQEMEVGSWQHPLTLERKACMGISFDTHVCLLASCYSRIFLHLLFCLLILCILNMYISFLLN